MGTRKQVEPESRQEIVQRFTLTNNERTAAIVPKGMAPLERKTFGAVVCELIRKGKDLVLSLDGFIQGINQPVERYITQETDGVVFGLEI